MTEARNKLVLATLATVVALVALGLWLLRGEAAVVANAAPEPADAAASPAPVATAPATADALPERTEAPPPPAPAQRDEPDLAHVRGRCVDERGAPLSGCTAKLDAWGRNRNDVALQGKVEWHDPAPLVTGDDGRFDFAFVPPAGMQFSFDVQADGRVPRTGRWGRIEPAQVIDLGDVVLAAGFAVRGRVVDERGLPVERVGVRLHNLPLPLAPNMAANDVRYGSSAANGEFEIQVPIPVGTWSLDVDARGVRLLSPDHVTVGERGVEPVLVTVRRMPTIAGIVVDEQGLPVAGVSVQADLQRSGRMAMSRSGQDGTFTIFAVDAEPKPVRLTIFDPGPCEPTWQEERLWEWGTTDVRIELPRALSFELTVVERGSGAPVTQYAVSCYSERSRSSLQRDLRLGGEHPGGRVVVDGVWRGKNVLEVVPTDQALQKSAPIEFEATDAGTAPLRVEIDRLQPATLRATTAGGAPVTGSKVEIVRKGTQPFDAEAFVQDSRRGNRGFSSDPNYRFHELIAATVTGTDGRAQAFLPPAARDLVVRVTGEHPPGIVDPAIFVPGQDFTVVVPDGGGIAGKVRLQGPDATRISVQAMSGEAQQQRRHQARLQADGSFALRGLTPGGYRLRLQYAVPYRSEHGGSSGSMDLGVEVPAVVVAAGRDSAVEIDATAVVPATLRGRLLVDGAVPPAARAFLRGGAGTMIGQFVPGADGVFEAPDLLPGTYRAVLVVGDFQAGEGDRIEHDETFVLAAGQELSRDFAFTRRRLVVTVLQADGKTPAATLELRVSGDSLYKHCATDAGGVLVLDPVPVGKIALHTMSGELLGTVEITAGAAEHAATLQLPVPKEAK